MSCIRATHLVWVRRCAKVVVECRSLSANMEAVVAVAAIGVEPRERRRSDRARHEVNKPSTLALISVERRRKWGIKAGGIVSR